MNKKFILIILTLLLVVIVGIVVVIVNKTSNSTTTVMGEDKNNLMQEGGANKMLEESEKRTAKTTLREGESMQTEDSDKATRVITGGTKIKMTFGDKVIYGVLNDSKTAKALIAKLEEGPITQHESRYTHDFCGVTEDLPYNKDDEHYGWLNGDIDYATDAPYFTILFKDEDISEQYGFQVNIGAITSNISEIDSLSGSYDMVIELDK